MKRAELIYAKIYMQANLKCEFFAAHNHGAQNKIYMHNFVYFYKVKMLHTVEWQ
jgi:hypothetical protein